MPPCCVTGSLSCGARNSFFHFLRPLMRARRKCAAKRFPGGKTLKSAGFTPDDLSQRKGTHPAIQPGGTMKEASKMLEFEYAAVLRDRIIELRGEK